jgi:D-alanyl-D-alanine carboxypeptidase
LARTGRRKRSRRIAAVVAATAVGLAGCVGFQFRQALFGEGQNCDWPGVYQPAASANAASLATLPIDPFGKPETGWAIYAPAIAQTAGTKCAATTPAFAWALAYWQLRHGLTPHGAVDPPTFAAMKSDWQQRRPFVRLRESGVCPDPPNVLATLTPEESRADKPVQLRPGALGALRRMVAAARRENADVAADPRLLTVFSGFRDPAADAARCAAQQNCQGLVRAECSAHRTGLAVDLYLGAAPGFEADSADDANRLFQIQTPAYRWLVANAARFGFVNYVYEPWHWEWTGADP